MLAPILQNLVWLLLVALGIKLILISYRARSVPEGLLGLALLSSGPGVSLLQHGIAELEPVSLRVAVSLISFGGACVTAFAVAVFRPSELWARALFGVLLVGYGIGLWHQLEQVELLARGVSRPSLVFLSVRFVGFAWCALEAARYRSMYVKRLSLGLADPVIANRFLLYAVWTAALATMPVIMSLSLLLDQTGNTWRMGLAVGARAVGAVVLVSMWLIFVPPRAYLRFVEARHASATPPGEPSS